MAFFNKYEGNLKHHWKGFHLFIFSVLSSLLVFEKLNVNEGGLGLDHLSIYTSLSFMVKCPLVILELLAYIKKEKKKKSSSSALMEEPDICILKGDNY